MLFQITAFGIVVIYLLYWYFREDDPGLFLKKFITVSAASWVVEETSIRIYHFYQYSPDWNLFIGHVPVLVILVWPLVIHSGWELASQFFTEYKLTHHLVAALIIWIDASLIETISVKSGLWSWNGTGFFGVPFIGICGWAYFAFLSGFILRLNRERKTGAGKIFIIFIFVVFGTHVLIIGTWWLIFRYILFPVNPAFTTALAWTLSLLFIFTMNRKNVGVNVDSKVLLIRIPPALIFLTLYLKGSPDAFHTTYALAFSLSYLFLFYKIYRGELEVTHKSFKTTLHF